MSDPEPTAPFRLVPDRSLSRVALLWKVARRGYFARGGFLVSADDVCVVPRIRRRRCSPRATVAGVVLTHVPSRTDDWRVLVVDDHDRVLVQDSALFYDDPGVDRLAQALEVSTRHQSFRRFRDLAKAFPGALWPPSAWL